MRQIIFKGAHLDEILERRRTQTVRFWKMRKRMKPGEIVMGTNYRRRVPLRLTHVEYKPVTEMTLDEAQRQGHPSVESLVVQIFIIYGRVDFNAVILRFEPVE